MFNPILTTTNSNLDTRVKEPSGVVPPPSGVGSPTSGPGSPDRFNSSLKNMQISCSLLTRAQNYAFLYTLLNVIENRNKT